MVNALALQQLKLLFAEFLEIVEPSLRLLESGLHVGLVLFRHSLRDLEVAFNSLNQLYRFLRAIIDEYALGLFRDHLVLNG